jgi:hypothetical protein
MSQKIMKQPSNIWGMINIEYFDHILVPTGDRGLFSERGSSFSFFYAVILSLYIREKVAVYWEKGTGDEGNITSH